MRDVNLFEGIFEPENVSSSSATPGHSYKPAVLFADAEKAGAFVTRANFLLVHDWNERHPKEIPRQEDDFLQIVLCDKNAPNLYSVIPKGPKAIEDFIIEHIAANRIAYEDLFFTTSGKEKTIPSSPILFIGGIPATIKRLASKEPVDPRATGITAATHKDAKDLAEEIDGVVKRLLERNNFMPELLATGFALFVSRGSAIEVSHHVPQQDVEKVRDLCMNNLSIRHMLIKKGLMERPGQQKS